MTFLTPAAPYRNPPHPPVHNPLPLYDGNSQSSVAGPSRIHPPPLVTRSFDMPPPPTIPVRRKRKTSAAEQDYEPATLAAAASSPSELDADEEDEDADDYLPTSAGPSRRPKKSTASAKGGGKSAAGTTAGGRPMSREQLRKANHSLIERRRREKINFALSELREMVPGLGDTGKGGEFKLEVLERTVLHMRALKARIGELESSVQSGSGSSNDSGAVRKKARPHEPKAERHDVAVISERQPILSSSTTRKSTTTPPSPSLSPDQSQSAPLSRHTSADAPAIASGRGSRNGTDSPQQPSIASLLSHAHPSQRPSPASQPTRPAAPPQAANPTLYLPFPTPSPTSPFLTYPGSNTSTTATSVTGPPEPSPFLAPLQHFSLFGGAISLDTPTSPEVKKSPSDHEGTAKIAPGEKKGDMRAEEAANLLLAFSSPDVMRPTGGLGLAMTTTSNGFSGKEERQRRMTLETEDFTLDGGTAKVTKGYDAFLGQTEGMVGKTARDILRMSD